jgi:hypothetical protein
MMMMMIMMMMMMMMLAIFIFGLCVSFRCSVWRSILLFRRLIHNFSALHLGWLAEFPFGDSDISCKLLSLKAA